MPNSTSSRAKRRDAVIGRSQIVENPFKCPVCGHGHVVLEGKWQRRFQKEFLEGAVVGVVFQEESYAERYTAVVCEQCNTRTEIEPDHVVELLAENVKLQMLAAGKRGVNVIETPSAKVM